MTGYKKKAESSCLIEYHRKKLRWQIRTNATSAPFAYIIDKHRTPLDLCTNNWFVLNNSTFEVNTNITVMSVEKRKKTDLEKYGDKLSKAVSLDVRGAVGVNAFKINGIYEPGLFVCVCVCLFVC